MKRPISKLWNGKHWVETLPITETLWKQLIQETHNSAVRNLDASEQLLSNRGSEVISAGLYTYAVEEFGKLLLLVNNTSSNQQVIIRFRDIFRSHEHKFPVAIEYLRENAPECIVLKGPLCDKNIFDPAIFDTTETLVKNFETRSAVFYCDIDDSGDNVRPLLFVSKDSLEKAIMELRKVLSSWQSKIHN